MPQPNLSSPFKPAFATVLSLTLASGGTALHLASQPILTEPQTRILDSALGMWTLGATTLIGLLGAGAVTKSNNSQED